jgi:hypothetical protein
MPISEAKKKSNQKWDKENMTNLAIRVRRTYADQIKKAAADAGTTPATIMRKAIDDFMKNYTEE